MGSFKNIVNYTNFGALILYIVGRIMNLSNLCWTGLLIMTLSSIWTIIHWKQNEKTTNMIAVAFLILVGLSIIGI